MRWQVATLVLILIALGAGVMRGNGNSLGGGDCLDFYSNNKCSGILSNTERQGHAPQGINSTENETENILDDALFGPSGSLRMEHGLTDATPTPLSDRTRNLLDADIYGARDTPTATVPPTPTDVPDTPSAEAAVPTPIIGTLEALICAKDWDCGEAIAVAGCESGRDADGKLDGTWAQVGHVYGLFQVRDNHGWPDMWTLNADGIPNWADPSWSIEHAHSLWQDAGGTFWADWKDSAYCWAGIMP